MIEASLDLRFWPGLGNRPHHGTLSIHGDIKGIQSAGSYLPKPSHGWLIAFLLVVGMGDDLLASTVHEADETSVFMKIGPIIDEILVARKIKIFRRPSIQPVGDDPPKLPRTVSRQVTELPDRITFGDPGSKPNGFFGSLDMRSPPNIGSLTLKTTVALFPQVRSSIPSNIITVAARAVLFFASYCLYH